MDEHDKRLLNALQADFPLVSRPFEALGSRVGIAEAEVIARLGEHKRRKIVRQIGGIFDTRSLGYTSSLVAMRVRPGQLDRAALVVNGHPGVTWTGRSTFPTRQGSPRGRSWRWWSPGRGTPTT